MPLSVSRRALAAAMPFVLAVSVANLFSVPAFAQAVSSPSDEVIVTATRSPRNASDVISDNVVISPEEIAQAGQTSLVELLQRQHGIEVTTTGGSGAVSGVFIRGASNSQSIVLVDGVRIGSSTIGGATWETIPLPQIDHVEIVYGPLSSMYGADAVGGVIQIFTKKGSGAPRFTASAGYGTYATRKEQAGVSGATGGDHRLSYALSVGHEASDGFSATRPGNFLYNPDKDGYTKDSGSGRLSLDVAKGHELGLVFLQSKLNTQIDNGLSDYGARNRTELESYGVYSKNELLPGWSSRLQLSQSKDKSGYDAGTTIFDKSQIDTTQDDAVWQNDLTLGTDTLQVLFERRKEEVDSDATPELAKDRTTNSASLAYQLKRGAHLASVSVRDDHSSQYGSHATGSVGYGYWMTDAWRVSASYGTSFRAPTFNELYFPGYGVTTNKPEQGRNAEAGLYYQSGDSRFSAVYYHNRLTDLLVYAPVCPTDAANHPFGCAYNVDEALLEGVSLNAGTAFDAWSVRGTLDLQNPHDETTGEQLARRARRHASIALEYQPGALKIGSEWVLSGKRFDDTANLATLGGYGLLNLYADYAMAKDWSLFVRLNNATDKNYELAQGYATPGRSVFVGVRYGMK